MELVSLNILNTNEKHYLKRCIDSALNQTYKNIEVLVVDNGSSDGSQEFVRKQYGSKVKLVENNANLGCSGGRNRGINFSKACYVMPIDANLFITPDYVEIMVKEIGASEKIGLIQGKLYRLNSVEENEPEEKFIDSCGIQMTKDRRNIDIGHGEEDCEKYNKGKEIFGPGGAAPLYRREMLEDVKIDSECFDESFFYCREEIDFNWRARLFGWECVYTPSAIAYHIRTYSPSTRKNLSRKMRYHQFRNRYLMIIKNDSWVNLLKDAHYILWFEIRAFFYVCLFEPFLLKAYFEVIKLFPEMRAKRKIIMKKKRVANNIRQWM